MMKVLTPRITGITSMAVIVLAAAQVYANDNSNSGQAANDNQQTSQQTGKSSSVESLEAQAQQAIQTFKQKDPTLDQSFFRNSAGYAVFPTVGEAALIVGGAHGKGLLYENGKPVGEATVTKGTVGAQAGGQSFSELIFFQTPESLQKFKEGKFEFSAGVSAVAAKSGVGRVTNYRNGVVVFTTSREGLMAKAAIGGQKFSYQPLAMGAGGLGEEGGTSAGTSGSATNLNPVPHNR